jgi:diguanylate cyclase (GGDEF)-like protein/PAS domain S-box-containing protein
MGKPAKLLANQSVDAHKFKTRFRNLIILAWTCPPVVGLSFLLYIRMFSIEQMREILTSPIENVFVFGSLFLAVWYFNYFIQPVVKMLATGDSDFSEQAARTMQRFPLYFWTIFLIYLLVAPSTVILSAEIYSDFLATPIDWFRIHLVALIVSIIVGLPIFFLILDLFGRALGPIKLNKPHITIKSKVFMIGALVPLLIDTMLVQYYWSRTGFFTFETFIVWLALELLAIAGSIIFVRSISQSLQPLQSWSNLGRSLQEHDIETLKPQSTDELGVLTTSYRSLIDIWRINNEILEINTRILRSSGSAATLSEIVDGIIRVCEEAIGDDMVFLILSDKSGKNLIGVAQTAGPYKAEGYYRLHLDETSIASWIFKQGKPLVIHDAMNDHRVNASIREKYKIRSAIGVPLKVGEKTIGVLMTISQSRMRNYSLRDDKLLEGMAREIAVAVQTHQLYQHRMLAELAKKDNEELLKLIMAATEEGIYGTDLDGMCIFINPAGLRMLGYDHENELLGKCIHEVIHHSHPDGSPYPVEQCAVKLATEKSTTMHSDQEMHWRKDGTGFQTEYWSHPIYKNGKIVGTVVTFIDITERMLTVEKLKYQAKVIDHVRDSIVATDLEGNVTSWNKGAERLFGYTEKYMLGRNISTVYPEDELPALEALVRKLKGQGTHEAEVRMQRHDGVEFFASLSLSMLFDDNNQPVGMIGYTIDITEQKADQENLRHQAYHDILTGLPNRWLLQDRIGQAIAIARRENQHGALMFLDLDRFKIINDTLGHEFGDEVLLVVANRLSNMVREGDTLARLGGDEFVLLLGNLKNLVEATDAAKRVLDEIKLPFQVRERDIHLGASIGIAGYPEHGEDAETLLKHADFAMYRAKEKGGDTYQYYTADIHQEASARYQLEYELHRAIDNNELTVNYQPLYHLETGAVVGLEALCRWNSQNLAEVQANEFIPVAEETGLITPLGIKLIQQVVDTILRWKDAGINVPRVAINLSVRQIYSDETLAIIRHIITDNGLPGEALGFEITESSLIDDPQLAQNNIKTIKDLGASIAIDDFGTGYSSLAYLKKFSIDVLKIDRSFISDLADNQDDQAIIETIIGMARNLGLSVVAEGVENKTQADFLLQRGCYIAQGYLFSKPLAENECRKLLTNNTT